MDAHTYTLARILPGTRRRIKQKTPIVYQGEVPKSGFFLQSGIVKVFTIHSNGEEQIVEFLGPGDFFPVSWLFAHASASNNYYVAIESCSLISVTKEDVKNIVMTNSAAKNIIFDNFVRDNAALQMRITALEQPKAVDKIVYTLSYLIYQFGELIDTDNGNYRINMPLTHTTIAALVGLTRETIATELNKLKRKDILEYSNKTYVVNCKKLEGMMGEDSFTTL